MLQILKKRCENSCSIKTSKKLLEITRNVAINCKIDLGLNWIKDRAYRFLENLQYLK